MKNNEALQKEIDKTLNCLDSLNQVEANPFLYGKIQQRLLLSKQESAFYGKWMYRFAFMISVLIAVNIYCFSSFLVNKNDSNKVTGIEAFAKEYNIETTIENI